LYDVHCKEALNTRTEVVLVSNDDMPILTYSTDLENVDPIAYFARNFVKLAILKRFEVVLHDHNGAAF
jgi:hypothetical protein